MRRIRVKVPVEVDLSDEAADVVASGVELVKRARSSGVADAVQDLFTAVSRATKRRRRRR